MEKPFDGGPAFPCPVGHIECKHPEGMSVRVWLAGMALAGRGKEFGEEGYGHDEIARYCLQQADAILARIKEGK